MNASAKRRERAFGVVEVVIAMILLIVIVSAVALAFSSGARLRGSVRVQAAVAGVADKTFDHLATDRSWMVSCTTRCSVLGTLRADRDALDSLLSMDDLEGRATLVTADSMPIDSRVDGVNGVGTGDRDGVYPDFYRVVIRVDLGTEVGDRYGVPLAARQRTFERVIDRTGTTALGSLELNVCEITNQSDERMQIQGCERGRTDIRMDGCPPPNDPLCTAAWTWVDRKSGSTDDPAPYVSNRRVGSFPSFRLVPVGGTGRPVASGTAKVANGHYIFENVPAGSYRLVGIGARHNGKERWETKELPSFHGVGSGAVGGGTISVDPGVRTNALVQFRPVYSSKGIDTRFDRWTPRWLLRGTYQSTQLYKHHAPTKYYRGRGLKADCSDFDIADNAFGCRITVHDSTDPSGTYTRTNKPSGWTNNCKKLRYEWDADGRVGIDDVVQMIAWYCSTYTEHHYHTYYGHSVQLPSIKLDGAVAADTYQAEVRPDNRYVTKIGASYHTPIPSCIIRRRKQQCSGGSVTHPKLGSKLHVGLNSKLENLRPDAVRNRNEYYTPNALSFYRQPMWARQNGSITTRTGTRSAARNSVRVTGLGECYWRNADRKLWSGWAEFGATSNPALVPPLCKPCKPMWSKSKAVSGTACALLVKTVVVRTFCEWRFTPMAQVHAKFRPYGNSPNNPRYPETDEHPWGPTSAEYAIIRSLSSDRRCYSQVAGPRYTNRFNPPWICTSAVPRTGDGGTCGPQSNGKNVEVPADNVQLDHGRSGGDKTKLGGKGNGK